MLFLAQQPQLPDFTGKLSLAFVVITVFVLLFGLIFLAIFAHYFRFWIQ